MVVIDSRMVSGCLFGERPAPWALLRCIKCTHRSTYSSFLSCDTLSDTLGKQAGHCKIAHCPLNFIFQNASPFVEDRFCFIMCTPDTRNKNSAGSLHTWIWDRNTMKNCFASMHCSSCMVPVHSHQHNVYISSYVLVNSGQNQCTIFRVNFRVNFLRKL